VKRRLATAPRGSTTTLAGTRASAKKSRARQAARWVLFALVTLLMSELVYLLLGNACLRYRLAALRQRGELAFESGGLWTLYPGDLRGRALRLRDASEGVSVDLRRVTAKLALWPLLRGRLELRELLAEGFQVAFDASPVGALQLKGPTRLRLARVSVVDDQLSAEGSLDLVGARVLRPSGVTLARARGRVTFRLLPESQAGGPGAWRRRLQAQGRLSAELSHVGQRWGASSGTAHARAELRFAVKRGRLASGALSLESSAADGRALGMAWSAPHGVDLALAWSGQPGAHLSGVLALRPVLLTLERPGADAPMTLPLSARLDVTSPLREKEPPWTRPRRMRGRLRLRSVGADGHHDALGLRASLRVERARWSERAGLALKGRLRASGRDAGVLLELMNMEPALSWSLSQLREQPFRLELGLSWGASGVGLDDIRLDTAPIAARGAFRFDARGRRGALLLQRGRLVLGLRVQDDSARLELKPGPRRLEHASASFTPSSAPP
jgi:hypothetical protein